MVQLFLLFKKMFYAPNSVGYLKYKIKTNIENVFCKY